MIKVGRTIINKGTGEIIELPSREDSLDRLLEMENQFSLDIDVADIAISAVMIEKMRNILSRLTEDEMYIITELFYKSTSESDLAKILGVSRTTVIYRKNKILNKLKKLL